LKENWANLNGLKIRYLESGKGNDRHVLFIHGLGSSADRWLGIPDVLSTNFHTIALDLPGLVKVTNLQLWNIQLKILEKP